MKPLPFVKWAGGKRQLLPEIVKRVPKTFNKYAEPFVGGGAVFFDLSPLDNAHINDINKALITTYIEIRDNPLFLMENLDLFDSKIKEEGKAFYYAKREDYNRKLVENEYDSELASLFIFLNKHCFNGLYRVNSKGLFNVPYNFSVAASYNNGNILAVSKALQKTIITNEDFEIASENLKEGDFVFFDSPYAPLKNDSFESYTKEGFSKENHERLARLFKDLSSRGCLCMLTNHNTDFINGLYKDYEIEIVDARRMINSKASERNGEEIIVCNY